MLTARTSRKLDSLDALRSAEFGLAVTAAEREAAFRLVHDQYVARGYIHPDPTGRRAGIHHLQPSTLVFAGRVNGDVIATVSLIPDSPALGLPCDDLYADELAPLRARGRRLAEVSALAIHERWRDTGLLIVRSLVQMIALYADRIGGLDTLTIAVNPRHARFYESCLRFRRVGAEKAYPAVNHAPAVALTLDLAREMRAPIPAAAVPFAAGLLDPGETDAVVASLRRDIARMHLLQSPARVLCDGDVAEVC